MPDVFTKGKRSQVMSRIRGHGNKDTELALAKIFRQNQITGWRRHSEVRSRKAEARCFRVKPDFVFRQARLAVFVDGCFWHGCPKHGTRPKSHRSYWCQKLARNKKRDQLVNRILRAQGWRVLRVWEHELAKRNETRLLSRIRRTWA